MSVALINVFLQILSFHLRNSATLSAERFTKVGSKVVSIICNHLIVLPSIRGQKNEIVYLKTTKGSFGLIYFAILVALDFGAIVRGFCERRILENS